VGSAPSSPPATGSATAGSDPFALLEGRSMITLELPAELSDGTGQPHEEERPTDTSQPTAVIPDWRSADDACGRLAGALRARKLETDFPHLRTAVNGFGRIVVHLGDVDPDVAVQLADLIGRSGSRRRRARPGPDAA